MHVCMDVCMHVCMDECSVQTYISTCVCELKLHVCTIYVYITIE